MSRHAERMDPVLEALARAWRANPDWRLCQLIGNAGVEAGRSDPFYVEDDELLVALGRLAKS